MSEKPSLLSKLSRRKPVWTSATCDTVALFGDETVRPTSEAQREVFSASVLNADASRAYNHSISIFFEGKLDVDALYSSLLNLIKRHEALRGTFAVDGATFCVREGIGFELPVVNLEGLTASVQKTRYDSFIHDELAHVFDLVRGPLFKSTLFRYSRTKWTLAFSCHHAVVDGWSLNNILTDLPKLYTALVSGSKEADLADAYSYTDYLELTAAREKESSTAVKQFWKRTFEDGVPALDLPLDKPRPMQRTYNCRREDYKIDRGVYERLKELGVKNGASQFATLLSAFALYLHRTSGQNDYVIGVPSAGQIASGKSKLLGHDARLLPVRCQLDAADTFKTFSARVTERFFSAYENQWISMPELIRELRVRQDPARIPFVSVAFSFDSGFRADEFNFEGLKSRHFFNHRHFETFEISINAVVEHGDMILECAYNADLFDAAEMHARLVQFEKLMTSITETPELPVSQLSLLPAKQISEMNLALNSTAAAFERELCVDKLIERIVLSAPKSVAVEYLDSQLSYEAVWAQSEKVASAVLAMGLGSKPLVGVMIDRTEALVPVLLGVWRAGGCFVPLDPAYPLDRLQYMVTHSDISLVLSDKQHLGSLEVPTVKYLDIAEILAAQSAPLPLQLANRSSDDLAYVIYTSGSTGKPKGVKVPHRTLNNFLCSMQKQGPGITAADRLLAVTTISFDIAELELWLPLITGARTVIVDRATAMDGAALIRTMEEKKISFLQATPGTWRLLICSGWEGNSKLKALCGGEALPREVADDILSRVGTLWNVYGPTETTVWSTLDKVGKGPITIGKPLANQQAYVLDANLNWVPRGVVGELWLGGEGVTDGYLASDELTRERFLPNNFTDKGHIYKTGDLVRLRVDGRIEFVGRNDFQVKVRGYRIELGEVQYALAQNPNVRQCVVVVKDKSLGDAQLVAYFSLKAGKKAKVSELKESMKGHVPDYMLPGYFMELGEMPMTQNGKINVKDLPEPFAQGHSAGEDFQAPRTEPEIYLARLWSELLGAARVGRSDRFLELGGTQFLAITAAHRIKKERATSQVNPQALLTNTLEQLAAEVGGNVTLVPSAATDAQHVSIEKPFFFGNPDAQKFGYFYEGSKAANTGVLICPPLGQEYMRTHWMIRNLSSALNRKGLPVMRFDFFGQGDSAGAPENVRLTNLCASVTEAVAELKSRTGVRDVKIVAFRAAALIVEQVLAKQNLDSQAIAIDAPLSGSAFLQEVRRTQKKRWMNYPFKKSCIKNAQYEELLGCLYSREWIEELSGLTRDEKSSSVALSPNVAVGWSDYRRLEQVWMAPDLIKKIQAAVLGEAL